MEFFYILAMEKIAPFSFILFYIFTIILSISSIGKMLKNEGVLYIPQSSQTGTSLSVGLLSYPGHCVCVCVWKVILCRCAVRVFYSPSRGGDDDKKKNILNSKQLKLFLRTVGKKVCPESWRQEILLKRNWVLSTILHTQDTTF